MVTFPVMAIVGLVFGWLIGTIFIFPAFVMWYCKHVYDWQAHSMLDNMYMKDMYDTWVWWKKGR